MVETSDLAKGRMLALLPAEHHSLEAFTTNLATANFIVAACKASH